MSLSFHSNKECLYLQVYEHYKNLIMERLNSCLEAACHLFANVLQN